jgi:hypothetical protein
MILCVTLLQGCTNSSKDMGFEVYLGKVYGTNVENYSISEKPLFTDADIQTYDWNTHEIIFDKDFLDKLKAKNNNDDTKMYIGGSKLFNTGLMDKFIVYVNKELVYEGFYMQSVLSSFYPVGATMVDLEDGIQITFNDIEGSNVIDKRDDQRIYNILKQKNIIKE